MLVTKPTETVVQGSHDQTDNGTDGQQAAVSESRVIIS